MATLSGAASTVAGAASFTGVNQINPFDTTAVFNQGIDAGGFLSYAQASIVTNTNNAWTFATLASNGQLNSPGAPQVLEWNNDNTVYGAGALDGPVATGGTTVTITWGYNWFQSIQSAIGVAALKAATTGGSVVSSVSWQEVIN
ncbi:MAG TPA: hypothetical protein VEI57_06260 [Nitrospirota bacterium]|nr:hypothetical protein [Nitrospirota bacterium]